MSTLIATDDQTRLIHLIVTHEVTNTGSDRSQLANVARQAKAVLQVEMLEAVADRGYYNGEEIVACDRAGITVTLPKPMTSGAKSEGRFGKQDFAYLPDEDVYRCPANEKLSYRHTNIESGQTLRRYWTNGCGNCALKELCTTGKHNAERPIRRRADRPFGWCATPTSPESTYSSRRTKC